MRITPIRGYHELLSFKPLEDAMLSGAAVRFNEVSRGQGRDVLYCEDGL